MHMHDSVQLYVAYKY